MISTVLGYDIEVYDEEAVVWRVKKTFTPSYTYNVYTKPSFWDFFGMPKKYQIIVNEKKARIRAKKAALRYARRLYPEFAVAIFVTFKFPEAKEPFRHCIWENGEYNSIH